MLLTKSLIVQEIAEFLEQVYRQHIHIIDRPYQLSFECLYLLRMAYSSCGGY